MQDLPGSTMYGRFISQVDRLKVLSEHELDQLVAESSLSQESAIGQQRAVRL